MTFSFSRDPITTYDLQSDAKDCLLCLPLLCVTVAVNVIVAPRLLIVCYKEDLHGNTLLLQQEKGIKKLKNLNIFSDLQSVCVLSEFW